MKKFALVAVVLSLVGLNQIHAEGAIIDASKGLPVEHRDPMMDKEIKDVQFKDAGKTDVKPVDVMIEHHVVPDTH